MSKPSPGLNASDVFFEMFKMADLTSKIHSVETLGSPQEIHFPAGQAYIHIIQQSECVLSGDRVLQLSAGDILVVLRGNSHRIRPSIWQDKGADDCVAPLVRIITATFKLEGLYGETIGNGLPDYIWVPHQEPVSDIGPTEWLPMTVAAIGHELDHPSLGSGIMLSRIIDLLLIWSIRYWLSNDTIQHKGWIFALKDAAISRALSLMHADPGFDWSVDFLAEQTHQSRSNFSRKFVELVGIAPMRYLMNWRMQLASRMMLTTHDNIAQIAEKVGYESQAAFSRVFKRTFGVTPTEYRETVLRPKNI